METIKNTILTVETIVNASIDLVWMCWTKPEHIIQWCHATDDWHAPYAENDLRKDGKFKTTMAAKDGSFSFNFEGVYTKVEEHQLIEYVLGDGRKVKITFIADQGLTKVIESFEAETINAIEMQQAGWQAIIDNFKKYTEAIS